MGYLLQHLATESAQRAPDAVAVRYEDESLTYAELEQRSNRLARGLQAEGVADGDRVGLHMKKTHDAIVALFAILKTGACVVPVHVATPAARLADIVRQCGMRCLVGSAESCAKLSSPELAAGPLRVAFVTDGGPAGAGGAVRLVSMAGAEAAQDGGPVPIATADTDLAYVLFTSGSTGRPKGVMLSHRAVLTFVHWAGDTFAIRADDRLSNHAPLNFDLSTLDIYAAMRAGASVTVIPEGLTTFPVRLAELIDREAITVWYSVPSVLSLLVARGGLAGRDLSRLRLVLFAGEVFPVPQLRELMLAVPAARFFNLYGPTETNVCTYHEVLAPPSADARPLPIGRACANTRTIVLDDGGAEVREPGREGLLYVRGSSVTDGYYGRPEETAASFRVVTLPDGRRQRLYCTGDWVTLDENGDYVFLGRRDHMVKVGGYRIELGEIEAALHTHPSVREAVAIAVPDDRFGSRIKAVVAADVTVDERALKRHCLGLLPRYMVPQEIELRDGLPRTATDKVDRPRLVAESTKGVAV